MLGLHSSHVKIALAFVLPVGMVWLFIYSQQEANRQVKEYHKEQQENPTTEAVVVKNYELKEVDDSNKMRWQLVAKLGVADQANQSVKLQDVTVSYFDGPITKMKLTAPIGEANESTRFVKLSSKESQRVIAEGEAGKAKLDADAVELTKNNQFVASGGVNIEWPGVAKVKGDSATGEIDIHDLQKFKVIGNTHTLITVK